MNLTVLIDTGGKPAGQRVKPQFTLRNGVNPDASLVEQLSVVIRLHGRKP